MYEWLAINSPADLAQLKDLIPGEYDPAKVADKLARGISGAVKGILIERYYVDKDYRSTYYNFYSKMGMRYRTDCIRLHFFDETVSFEQPLYRLRWSGEPNPLQDHYFGFMVLRPTGIATIGRSVVSPDVRSGCSGFIVSAKHKVHLLGYTLTVEGFPSMDQHIDIAVCAHVACWAILRHYSERYCTYSEFLTHDITMMAQHFDPGGLVPSRGLQVSHAERVFQEARTFPVHVTRSKSTGAKPTDGSFYRQLGAYLESAFPLFAAMHDRRHAVAVVGYEWRQQVSPKNGGVRYAWDEVESIVVVDDNHLPYLSVSATAGSPYSAQDIDAFIVALPEKVFYPADAVDKLEPALFKFGPLLGLPAKEDTILRYFITTGSALRRFVREHESEFDPKLVEAVMVLPLAQFVWIVEFATETQWSAGRITARAIIDATASLRDPAPLWLFHGQTTALVFDRQKPNDPNGVRVLALSDPGHGGFSRMVQNLRPTQTK